MTKNEYRQFETEVEFVGKDKNFVGIFNKLPKGFSFKSSDKILKDKKKAYDFMISKLFDKYGIQNKNLFDELDTIWKEQYNLICNNKFKILNYITPQSYYVSKVSELDSFMKGYISATCKYCCDFAKSEIDE